MNDPTNLYLPIDNYFECIDNYIQYACGGKTPYTAAQVIQKAHYAVLAPPDPVVYLTVPMNATVDRRYQPQLNNNKVWILYKHAGTVEKVLKNQVIKYIKDTYSRS